MQGEGLKVLINGEMGKWENGKIEKLHCWSVGNRVFLGFVIGCVLLCYYCIIIVTVLLRTTTTTIDHCDPIHSLHFFTYYTLQLLLYSTIHAHSTWLPPPPASARRDLGVHHPLVLVLRTGLPLSLSIAVAALHWPAADNSESPVTNKRVPRQATRRLHMTIAWLGCDMGQGSTGAAVHLAPQQSQGSATRIHRRSGFSRGSEGSSGRGSLQNLAEREFVASCGLNLRATPPILTVLTIPTHLPMSDKSGCVMGSHVCPARSTVQSGRCSIPLPAPIYSSLVSAHFSLPVETGTPESPLSFLVLTAARLRQLCAHCRQQACQQTLTPTFYFPSSSLPSLLFSPSPALDRPWL